MMKLNLKHYLKVVSNGKVSNYGVSISAVALAMLGASVGQVQAAMKPDFNAEARIERVHQAPGAGSVVTLSSLDKNDNAINTNQNIASGVTVTQAEVADPVINEVRAGDAAITGAGEPGAQINVFMDNPNGGQDIFIGNATVDFNGRWLVNASHYNLREGDVLYAYQGEGAQIKGAQTTVKANQGDVPRPAVDSVKAGAGDITGQGKPGYIITIYLKEPDGNNRPIGSGPVDQSGNWQILVPINVELEVNDVLEIYQSTLDDVKSEPVQVTVTE